MSSTALNTLNGLFYSSFAGDMYSTGLAQLYSHNREIFQAFSSLFTDLNPHTKQIRVKHLSAGSRSYFVWKEISCQPSVYFDVEVSDIVRPFVSNKIIQNCQISTSEHDLRHSFSSLDPASRFDLIFATYSFDSVWFTEDCFYRKKDGQWFEVSHQISINDSPQTPSYISGHLKSVLESGVSQSRLPKEYFAAIDIHETEIPIDIISKPYGNQIQNYFADHANAQCAFPGGMIKRIKEAFEHQLNPNGSIVLGEVIIPNKQTMTALANRNCGLQRSGTIARYKIEDYGLAQHILKKEGIKMELIPINQWIRPFAPKGKLHIYDQISDTNHIVIISQ